MAVGEMSERDLSCEGYTNYATFLIGFTADNVYETYLAKWDHLERWAGDSEGVTPNRAHRFARMFMWSTLRELEGGFELGERAVDINWDELAQDWAADWAEREAYIESEGG